MNTNYRDVEITYNEVLNVWKAEGYNPKDSLAFMKQAIDRHLDKDPDKKKAEKIPAFMKGRHGGEGFESVIITSRAEDGGLWYTTQDGKRQKANKYNVFRFYEGSPENAAAIAKWTEIQKQIDGLKESQSKLKITNLSAS